MYLSRKQEGKRRRSVITGQEAPISVSCVVYYRGVAVTITKRDPDQEIKTLVEQEFRLIDWALEEKLALPSWNQETNKAIAPKSEKWIDPPANTNVGNCPKCGATNKLSKAGKPYCSKLCWK